MTLLKRISIFLLVLMMVLACWQCAQRGTPTGGPKDETPPVLIKADPPNMTVNFNEKRIRLYFDEYIKLTDVQNQLIVSPPLKYLPEIKPLGGAMKFIEINLKDTLRANTTYTINFGQSIVDHNEGNPTSFLSYVFSTGDYIDSLKLAGAVKDAFNKKADEFVSVMLYEMDSSYNDSTIFKHPPNYITNTLDSVPFFELKNLKAGHYALFGITDKAKNNVFDQRSDKIGFLSDTIQLPTDEVYLLNLFMERPDYSVSVPSYAAKNKIIFGYQGEAEAISINTLTQLPDSVKTMIRKDSERDSLNYWLTPTDIDSIIFTVANVQLKKIDTFTVKTRKLAMDTLRLDPSHRGKLGFEDEFHINASTPLVQLDTSKVELMNQDSLRLPIKMQLDTIRNKVIIDFEKLGNQKYNFTLLPGAVQDFFGSQNDTLQYRLSTGSYADYGNLRMNITGAVEYPIIVQLTSEKGEVKREVYATEPRLFEFNNLDVGNYALRVIFDANDNGKWDTGNYLKKLQPEKVSHWPEILEMRANWDEIKTFNILE
ncbi:MAG: Ig-like domain-containing protein [Croceitalea sp.]|nr:Ig-like domain-containing protein [Croceitalea sp.]NNL10072.1 Ig-like domain-containing protein [Croceitalea sp.]NNM19361.1 Ig-like domain-containing protein [Croceitalea sp.]